MEKKGGGVHEVARALGVPYARGHTQALIQEDRQAVDDFILSTRKSIVKQLVEVLVKRDDERRAAGASRPIGRYAAPLPRLNTRLPARAASKLTLKVPTPGEWYLVVKGGENRQEVALNRKAAVIGRDLLRSICDPHPSVAEQHVLLVFGEPRGDGEAGLPSG
eukprot:Hpha_TRINITY_DN20284_c0_g1::TRINITY_DN20284_c0_g1_i1::g.168278::m.168278